MAERAKRPRSARDRTLPPDAASLEAMVRSVHRELLQRAEHCKVEPHDTHARRGLQTLFEQRAGAWQALHALAPDRAMLIARELRCIPSQYATIVRGVAP
ncbi:MAG: hypothetical protein Q7S96_01635 [bacterium]|nr:hypothetical protein [bacterium]